MNKKLAATIDQLDDATDTAALLIRAKQQLEGDLFHELFKRIVPTSRTASRLVNALLDGGFDFREDSPAPERLANQNVADELVLLLMHDFALRLSWDE